jgi:3-oxoacyl-[acyl-carrier-protein] synthase III
MKIIGTGRCLGKRLVTSTELDRELGLLSGTIERKIGVSRRSYVGDGECQISMGCEAARKALMDAGVTCADVDLVISGAAVPYQPIPNTASLYMRELGFEDGSAEALDVNMTCLSFLSALSVVRALMATGRCKRALVISSEVASRGLPWERDPETAALFGDGAGAIVVERGEAGNGGVRAELFKSYPSAWQSCQLASGGTRHDVNSAEFDRGTRFDMDGRALFRATKRHLAPFLDELLTSGGVNPEDIDLVIPHQASPLGLAHLKKTLGFRDGVVMDHAATLGNQIAASLPTMLDISRHEGAWDRARLVLLLGTSAGLSLGGMLWEVDQ